MVTVFLSLWSYDAAMGLRGPRPTYDVGAFVLAVQMGARNLDLAAEYGITLKAVERRIHRLRVAGLLPPAVGRERPMRELAEERAQRERERLARIAQRKVRRENREAREALEHAEREAAERARIAQRESDKRRDAELAWHRERERQQTVSGAPVLDLFM